MCSHSRNVNPYTHRDAHSHAQRRKRTDRACKPAKSRQPVHSRSHAHQTHPANAHSGTRRAIHSTFTHQLRLSATLVAAVSRSPRASAECPSTEPWAFHHPSWKTDLGPQTLPSPRAPRAISKLPNSPSWDTSLGCRPGALPLPGPRAPLRDLFSFWAGTRDSIFPPLGQNSCGCIPCTRGNLLKRNRGGQNKANNGARTGRGGLQGRSANLKFKNKKGEIIVGI